jgi:hypothetical protein
MHALQLRAGQRRAFRLPAGGQDEVVPGQPLAARQDQAPARPVDGLRPGGGLQVDPRGCVEGLGLEPEPVGGQLADPTIAYVYADRADPTPYGRCLEVVEVLPFSLKRLRAALRAAGVGRVEIMKRGSALDPQRLRQQLRLAGPAAVTVVLTRVAGAPTALLCQPLP